MDPVSRSRWRTAVLVTAVFVAGAAAGGFTTRALQQRRMRELVMGDPAALRTALTLHALDRRLGLTANQRAAAERVLHGQEASYRRALECGRPEVRALRREMAQELGPALTPAQRATLAELVQEGERFR